MQSCGELAEDASVLFQGRAGCDLAYIICIAKAAAPGLCGTQLEEGLYVEHEQDWGHRGALWEACWDSETLALVIIQSERCSVVVHETGSPFKEAGGPSLCSEALDQAAWKDCIKGAFDVQGEH